MFKNYNELVGIINDPSWVFILDNPYKILVIGGSESDKTNVLVNLTKHQRTDNVKISLYVNDPFESKYQLLTNVASKRRD